MLGDVLWVLKGLEVALVCFCVTAAWQEADPSEPTLGLGCAFANPSVSMARDLHGSVA